MAQSLPRPAGSQLATSGAAGAGQQPASNKDIPRDARIIGLLLASLGVTDAEPGVVAMLLEFAHRGRPTPRNDRTRAYIKLMIVLALCTTGYTLEILQDAQAYAEHAQRPRDPSNPAASSSPLEVDDLRMAVQSKLEHSYSSPLPKEFLLPLAAQINRVPLPIIPDSYGIRLPHERDRLTAVNWDLAPLTERRTYPELDAQMALDSQIASTSQLPGSNGSLLPGTAGQDPFNAATEEDDEEDDDDDDDDDDEDMEEVTGTEGQSRDAHAAEGDEGDEDDAENDEDGDENGDDDEEEEDAEGGEDDDENEFES